MFGPKDYLKIGEHNVFCDRCGFKFKSSELRKEWQGFMVCSECWEPRHPQELIRAIADKPAPPWSRPRNDMLSTSTPTYYVASTPMADNSGTTTFTTYGPVDKDSL